ncbi:type VI secretion system baseplate subunit TssG [Niveispirillum irakense]|uniref:type VI secretion system baseplate subunit TssG n=1 Tax=Niveispirillum irakense TaxID=34011 RepID=UPI0004273E81|nr:type VI secretion system baseplate subunit TssG [Niveispirillum irakense]
MAVPSGHDASPLTSTLSGTPHRFSLFQAVRLLLRRQPREEAMRADMPAPVRFRIAPRLGFAAAPVQAIMADGNKPPVILTNMPGLTGQAGVMPRPYSAFLLQRDQREDTAATGFFDLLHERLLWLEYKVWERTAFAVLAERGAGLGPLMAALAGHLSPTTPQGEGGASPIPPDCTRYFAGLMSHRARSAKGLAQILTAVLGVPVAVAEFTHTQPPTPPHARTRLLPQGRHQGRPGLGQGTMLGARMHDIQSALTIQIGPLERADYLRLSGNGAPGRLLAFARDYLRLGLDIRLRFILAQTVLHPQRLGPAGELPSRLGMVWLRRHPNRDLCDDHVMSPSTTII